MIPNSKLLRKRFIIIGVVLLVAILTALPSGIKDIYPDVFLINALKDAKVNLGLDLKGGTRLEYNVDLRGAPEDRKSQIISGVKGVLEKRVNSIGVSEPNIYQSVVGSETHMIVELAGVDIDQAKAVVGKVIQLEFKEQNENPGNLEEENMQKKAQEILATLIQSPDKFATVGGKEFIKDSIEYNNKTAFYDEINEAFRDKLWNAKQGDVLPQVYQADNGYTLDGGQLVQKKGLFVLKKGEETTTLRTVPSNTSPFEGYKSADVSYEKQMDINLNQLDNQLE